jgi:hypothetical protein
MSRQTRGRPRPRRGFWYNEGFGEDFVDEGPSVKLVFDELSEEASVSEPSACYASQLTRSFSAHHVR